MDPLLKQLEASGLGLSVNNFYAGEFPHVDDISTLATRTESLSAQAALVKSFTKDNFLKLNVQKCKIVTFDREQKGGVLPKCKIEGSILPSGFDGKYFSYWWRRYLIVTCAVEGGIRKTRRFFSLFGSIRTFQGGLSPLSTKSIMEICIVPVLMYGCENWIVT